MANPRPDPTPMQLDIAARILISRANGCGDLRGRFGPISELVFERLVEDARIALWDRPAKQAGGGETSESGLLVGPEPGRARLSAQSILDVYFGVRADVDWMRDRGLHDALGLQNNRRQYQWTEWWVQ